MHLFPDALELRHALASTTGRRFSALNDVIVNLLDEFAMVSFTPLDISDEDSIEAALLQVDTAIQVRPLHPIRLAQGKGGGSRRCMLGGPGKPPCASCASDQRAPPLSHGPIRQYGEDQEVRQTEYGDFPDEELAQPGEMG